MHVQRGLEVHERKALPDRIAQVGLVQETAVIGAGAEDGNLHGRVWAKVRADHTAAAGRAERPWHGQAGGCRRFA